MTVAALIVTACGGGDGTSDSGASPVVDTDAELVGGLEPDPAAGPDAGFDVSAAESVERTAATTFEFFGDLATAGVAVLSAYDDGFTFDQIVEAVAAGALTRDGTVDGAEPEEAVAAFQSVGFRPLPRELDLEKLREALAEAQRGFGTASIKDAPEFFLELILHAAHDGYSVDVIVEAIIFGGFTDATTAEMQSRNRELRREELRDELEYCRMRGAMGQITGFSITFEQCVLDQTGQSVDDLYGPDDDSVDPDVNEAPGETEDPVPTGSGGFGANPVIPGPDGSMTRQSITLVVEGDRATLTIDVAFTTAVDYEDEAPVCFDDFTFTSGASNLVVDGSSVTGTTELILNFDGATSCPQTEQDEIGIPQAVDIKGNIEGGTLIGELSIEDLGIGFTAVVGATS